MQKALFPIKSLFGLKVLFLAAIFCWHSGAIAKPKWDLGWIGVQFFFMCSGFLVGYNFSGKHVERENLLFPFRYVWQKLVRVWPIHFLGFAVAGAVVYLPSQYWHFDLWFKGIVNLLLFQSWAGQTDFIMSFNGVSWFLSSLFFCYFIAPFFAGLLRPIGKSMIVFALVLIVRVAIAHWHDAFNINEHFSPFVRGLEFALGFLVVPVFLWIRYWTENCKSLLWQILFSIAEVGIIFLLCWVFAEFGTGEARWLKALCFLPLILVVGLEHGYVSTLNGIKDRAKYESRQLRFKRQSSEEFECYVHLPRDVNRIRLDMQFQAKDLPHDTVPCVFSWNGVASASRSFVSKQYNMIVVEANRP